MPIGRIVVFLVSACALLMAQAPAPYDPAKDVDMTLFLSHWKNSPPRQEHGSLVVRDLFTGHEGDLLRPARPGTLLTQFSEFARAFLYTNSSTRPEGWVRGAVRHGRRLSGRLHHGPASRFQASGHRRSLIAVAGDIHTLLGKRLFKLEPGSAFKNPGDGTAYHANINTSEEQIKLIWIRAVAYKGK
jgi:hypothetical protein